MHERERERKGDRNRERGGEERGVNSKCLKSQISACYLISYLLLKLLRQHIFGILPPGFD